MGHQILTSLIISVLLVCFSVQGFAQQSNGFQVGASEERSASGPRKQLATIIYAGLGGAVLGLSTLSFYGRPQEKLSNIAIGFAVGVIAGTAMVTYRAATNPQEFYAERDHSSVPDLVPESERIAVASTRGIEDSLDSEPHDGRGFNWGFSWTF